MPPTRRNLPPVQPARVERKVETLEDVAVARAQVAMELAWHEALVDSLHCLDDNLAATEQTMLSIQTLKAQKAMIHECEREDGRLPRTAVAVILGLPLATAF